MIPGVLDYRTRADLYRPKHEGDFASSARALASQGLTQRDIAQHLRLDPGAVRRLLNATPTGGSTMTTKPIPHHEASDLERRVAAQEAHARDAARSVTKFRQPTEVLTADERATIERSKGAA